jgi:hypothetical protein
MKTRFINNGKWQQKPKSVVPVIHETYVGGVHEFLVSGQMSPHSAGILQNSYFISQKRIGVLTCTY